jgi:hypothetical protein
MLTYGEKRGKNNLIWGLLFWRIKMSPEILLVVEK